MYFFLLKAVPPAPPAPLPPPLQFNFDHYTTVEVRSFKLAANVSNHSVDPRWSSCYHSRLWIRGSRVRSRPGDGFFSERKNPEYDFLRKGSKAKPWVPCRRFTTRKEPQAEIRASEQNLSDFSCSMLKATLMTWDVKKCRKTQQQQHSASTKLVSLGLFTERKPNLIERFIGTDTASVVLFFNLFTSGIETFVIPWDQLLYSCVVEVCRLKLPSLCDTHLVSRVPLQIFTVLIFAIFQFYE